jgi:hypothetical protein
MTSYPEYEDAVAFAERKIATFKTSPFNQHQFTVLAMQMNKLLERRADMPDLIPTIIERSKTDRLAFILLKLLAADYERNDHQKPNDLSMWLISFLTGEIKEPTWGSTGPKKKNHKHLFTILIAHQVRELTGLPLRYVKEDPKYLTSMHIIAAASHNDFAACGSRTLPTTPRGMDEAYFTARSAENLSFFW